ncbi:MAG TPA: dTDP-4-dehydrorhamnose 3,5-epimerase [Alphaproteobacteria bacterium]|nr:dTDP-4-dehydrorhamnose 3,5-epimerase [Alphaproteobacteria bacterium]
MITVKELAIPAVKLLSPKLHHDDRGYVTEIVHERQMQDLGIPIKFMQENQTMTLRKNTVRGLHAQRPPNAQAKFVRVLRGKIFDVAVDVRAGSPTYGQHVSATLSEDEVTQMFIPTGFLHGFCTLTDNTVVLYKMSSLYTPGSEVGALWNDPDLKIQWPVDAANVILSGKDEKLPHFKDFPRLDW